MCSRTYKKKKKAQIYFTMKSIISEKKSILGGTYNRLDTTEENISRFENWTVQVIHNETQKEEKNLK